MALSYEAVVRALVSQIQANISRDTNVNPFPIGGFTPPQITVYPDSPVINYFDTFGASGQATIKLKLKLEVEGDDESVFIKICDYLSVGTGNASSVHDAVMTDHTLGGVVSECVVLTAEWDAEHDPAVAWFPVQIIVSKTNAKA